MRRRVTRLLVVAAALIAALAAGSASAEARPVSSAASCKNYMDAPGGHHFVAITVSGGTCTYAGEVLGVLAEVNTGAKVLGVTCTITHGKVSCSGDGRRITATESH